MSNRKTIAVKDEIVEGQVIDAPTARLSGSFRLYDLPDGGLHIAWIPDDAPESETQHIEIPGQVVKVAKLASEGKLNPMDVAKVMMGQL